MGRQEEKRLKAAKRTRPRKGQLRTVLGFTLVFELINTTCCLLRIFLSIWIKFDSRNYTKCTKRYLPFFSCRTSRCQEEARSPKMKSSSASDVKSSKQRWWGRSGSEWWTEVVGILELRIVYNDARLPSCFGLQISCTPNKKSPNSRIASTSDDEEDDKSSANSADDGGGGGNRVIVGVVPDLGVDGVGRR